ncbi:MAG TPA: metal-sensitive transcriptional regulator [Candidatus Paceibacterota bacterium]|nr:metal-sensitive transcriptional regulator [Candidatus Paceibacterota bacterium]
MKQAIRRLRLIAGQIRGLEKMVQENKYCINILHQSLAAKRALSSFEELILKNHLSTHVIKQMKSGNSKKAVEEITSLYKFSAR